MDVLLSILSSERILPRTLSSRIPPVEVVAYKLPFVSTYTSWSVTTSSLFLLYQLVTSFSPSSCGPTGEVLVPRDHNRASSWWTAQSAWPVPAPYSISTGTQRQSKKWCWNVVCLLKLWISTLWFFHKYHTASFPTTDTSGTKESAKSHAQSSRALS